MKRVLHIEVSSLEGSLQQFGEALEAVMRGEEREPYEGVGFESFTQLLDTLTPKRWALIERLKREGPLTVYALAKTLGRDYKNVHTDVKALEDLGVIERDSEGRVTVPWDEVEVKVPLAA
jgi:predicted transcriptional regulator